MTHQRWQQRNDHPKCSRRKAIDAFIAFISGECLCAATEPSVYIGGVWAQEPRMSAPAKEPEVVSTSRPTHKISEFFLEYGTVGIARLAP